MTLRDINESDPEQEQEHISNTHSHLKAYLGCGTFVVFAGLAGLGVIQQKSQQDKDQQTPTTIAALPLDVAEVDPLEVHTLRKETHPLLLAAKELGDKGASTTDEGVKYDQYLYSYTSDHSGLGMGKITFQLGLYLYENQKNLFRIHLSTKQGSRSMLAYPKSEHDIFLLPYQSSRPEASPATIVPGIDGESRKTYALGLETAAIECHNGPNISLVITKQCNTLEHLLQGEKRHSFEVDGFIYTTHAGEEGTFTLTTSHDNEIVRDLILKNEGTVRGAYMQPDGTLKKVHPLMFNLDRYVMGVGDAAQRINRMRVE